ncbi:MAG: tetratricopeptide repeat protein [Candidatus Omnitrophica bacterium]|nr:tetratricopeptide repeat protein [Candidatus Omnitrophota bacterium]
MTNNLRPFLFVLLVSAMVPLGVMLTGTGANGEREAEKHFAEGNLLAAAKSWEKMEKERPREDLYEKISICYLSLGDKIQARQWLEAGLTRFPRCGNLLFNLAWLDYSEQRWEDALRLTERLVEINPNFPEAHYLRGCILEAQGRRKEAKKQFIEEINRNPGSKKTWQKLKESVNEQKR